MRSAYPLWLFLLLSVSCTTAQEVTTIVPEGPEGHHAMGREYIPLGHDQIGVELGFDGILGDHLVFDFVVHNMSSDTLFIRPERFFYVTLDSANAAFHTDTSWYAVTPDSVLLQYDRILEDREKVKGTNAFLGILQASVDLLYNTSGYIATEDPGFIVDAVFQTAGTAEHYVSKGRQITSEMEEISEEKELVNEEIYRTCLLPPGRVKSGYVYFPLNGHAAFYMFCFPVGDQLFQYVYRQEKQLVY